MEEVDKIIIDSLRHINCDIDDEITSLKMFEPDIVVAAISTCLETMHPQIKLSKKLPASMSAKIKFASTLAQHIRELGFKGDMGYQTILYCNEVDVRRVLMFLIERLPKESSAIPSIEPMGYVPKIVKQIEDSLKQSLSKMWLPSEILTYGTRDVTNGMLVNSFGDSCPVDSVNLIIPTNNESLQEHSHILPINQQCSPRQLIPSLLYQDTEFSNAEEWKSKIANASPRKDITSEILNIISTKSPENPINISSNNKSNKMEDEESKNITQDSKTKADVLLRKLQEKNDTYISLQNTIESNEEKLVRMKSQRSEEQKLLKDSVAKVKVKNKTMAVLNNEENIIKLKNLIHKSENRMAEFEKQWKEVQTPLLEEYTTLKSSTNLETLKYQDEQNKVESIKTTYRDMVVDFKEKSILEQTLIKRCKELNNKNSRAAYTKRILEIVGNIKKQNNEIQKVLTDTKQVQKDIHNLTGQVDRSFTLSDELIFYDCKHDEAARKAYKFLAALREECNGILQAITNLGQAERELRNLEEQIETEKNKEVMVKLEKVKNDLMEIRKEIELLM